MISEIPFAILEEPIVLILNYKSIVCAVGELFDAEFYTFILVEPATHCDVDSLNIVGVMGEMQRCSDLEFSNSAP